MATYYQWCRTSVSLQEISSFTVSKKGDTLYFYRSSGVETNDDGDLLFPYGSQNEYPWGEDREISVGVSYFKVWSGSQQDQKRIYKCTTGTVKFTFSGDVCTVTNEYSGVAKTFDRYDSVNFISTEYSTNQNLYPYNNDIVDNICYSRQSLVSPTAPTGLTYPNPITTSTVTVSWQAATGVAYPIDHYSLSWGGG